MGDILNMSLDDIIKKNKVETGGSKPEGSSRGSKPARARSGRGGAGEEGAGRPAARQLGVSGKTSGVRKGGSGRGRVLVVSPDKDVREIFVVRSSGLGLVKLLPRASSAFVVCAQGTPASAAVTAHALCSQKSRAGKYKYS